MKIIRRTLGILLSIGISLGLLICCAEVVYIQQIHNFYVRSVISGALWVFIVSLPSFLSALFTPKPKKYGAIAGLSIGALFLFFLIIYSLFSDESREYNVSIQFVVSISACFSGAAAGFTVSYLVFKNKGWETPATEVEIPETY